MVRTLFGKARRRIGKLTGTLAVAGVCFGATAVLAPGCTDDSGNGHFMQRGGADGGEAGAGGGGEAGAGGGAGVGGGAGGAAGATATGGSGGATSAGGAGGATSHGGAGGTTSTGGAGGTTSHGGAGGTTSAGGGGGTTSTGGAGGTAPGGAGGGTAGTSTTPFGTPWRQSTCTPLARRPSVTIRFTAVSVWISPPISRRSRTSASPTDIMPPIGYQTPNSISM